jgi:NAD+ diphosphatase
MMPGLGAGASVADTIPFSGNTLDRSTNERRESAWVQAQLAAPATRFLPFWRLNALVNEGETPALRWLDAGVCGLVEGATVSLLGVREGCAHFAVDVSALEEPLVSLAVDGARFADVRSLATTLPVADAGIIAHARSLLDWHHRHRFCSTCGALTAPNEGGTTRICAGCGAQHFPRTDPVVIMVVWRGDRCVLGSRPGRATNYSALAGYIDQGETIEEAVRREVLEEVGVIVDEVEYVASQPWPFPSTLMIGCFAHAAGEELKVDPVEIDDARWFTREEVRRAVNSPDPSLGFTIPGRVAIAHHLLKAWSERESGADRPIAAL